jgi:hypothetical protein
MGAKTKSIWVTGRIDEIARERGLPVRKIWFQDEGTAVVIHLPTEKGEWTRDGETIRLEIPGAEGGAAG